MKLKDFPDHLPRIRGDSEEVHKGLRKIVEIADIDFEDDLDGNVRPLYVMGINQSIRFPGTTYLLWTNYRNKETGNPSSFLYTKIEKILDYKTIAEI